ncbi:MAG: hypothetical protein KDC98_05705 [Planctomycetes bacterium]|nr:hypothetical protein [Planctomycetota bacterium]
MRLQVICLLWALAAAAAAAAAGAQTPVMVPDGFRARTVMAETATPAAVRTVAFTGDGFLVAIGRDLEMRRPGATPRVVFRLHPGQDFAFVVATANGGALIGELNGGAIRRLDLATGTITATFAGATNAFDAVALPTGDVLLAANPLWPMPGADSGIWLAGPGRSPRELLRLSGPSAPLVMDANGDLIAAELGPIVPPPPGAARVLRFPANLLQQAIAGATLRTTQASAIGSGYGGIYDLAFDDLGRLHATDPTSPIVVHCAAGSLSPSGTTIDLGAGRYALQLAFVDAGIAPFRGFQPPQHAPALLISHSDFWQSFETTRLEPMRPELAVIPGGALPPGPATLTITSAPRNGLALFAMSTAAVSAEQRVASLEGVPLWLGIPPTAPIAALFAPIDAQGMANVTFVNPGGHTVSFSLQAVALGAPGTAALGSSLPTSLQLLP